ncbi:1-phosphatidylinositol 4-kinase [Malassezia vespertilionis]|uniref:1-phosphatidylinositol 4-kinase n=1 Tax=Malassezia vespertilionis TaxID=2020962 RepID=UPI0024B253AA|nr:1-phosphatidylinositol 4-kinase [Malassezia vespertilionis]WFD06061.1 1-phosphatidylinositol 4-kinase [Malassezia vespertilionis]
MLTNGTVQRYLAEARFAAATADAVSECTESSQAHAYLSSVLGDLERILSQLPHLDMDERIQVQPYIEWPVLDELAYSLTEAILKIGTAIPSLAPRTLKCIGAFSDALVALCYDRGDTRALVMRTVPLMHGFARAVQYVSFAYNTSFLFSMVSSLGRVAADLDCMQRLDAALVCLPSQRDAAAQCAIADGTNSVPLAETARHVNTLVERYRTLGVPLSGRFVAWCALSTLASIYAQLLLGDVVRGQPAYAHAWARLQRAEPKQRAAPGPLAALAQDVYTRTTATVLHTAQQTLRLYPELYARELLSTACKIITLGVAGEGAQGEQPFVHGMFSALLSEHATLQDPLVQRATLESINVLVHVRPSLAPSLAAQLREFVQLPLPLWEADLASGSPLLSTAAQSLAQCVCVSEPGLAPSLMYALLNNLGREADTCDAKGRIVPSDQGVVVGSTVAVITRLAQALKDPSVTVLAITLLLQRLQGSIRAHRGALLTHLAPLALSAPTSSFVNVMNYFTDAARTAMREKDTQRLGAVQSAQIFLARGLTRTADEAAAEADRVMGEKHEPRQELYLNELLALGIEAGMRTGDAKRDPSHVLSVVPILAALLAHPDLNPHWAPQPTQVYLFRNLWTVLSLNGATGPLTAPMPPNDPFSIIALKTPTLIPESAVNYIDEDIEYNSVLKQDTFGASVESVRNRIAPVLGARLVDGRIPLSRLAFLLAVLEVEWRRSAAGRPSMMLWYFAHPAIPSSSLAAPLRAMCDRTFAAYLVHASQRAEEHALGEQASDEVRNLLVGMCHSAAHVRQVANGYVERLVSAFPELFGRMDVVVTMLEMLTILAKSCDGEVEDAFLPQYYFTSVSAGFTLGLSDSYALRKNILVHVYTSVRTLLSRVQSEMPQELSNVLLRYLRHVETQPSSGTDGLGKSVALDFARGIPPSDPASFSAVRHDASGMLTRDLTAQSMFYGEIRAQPAIDSNTLLCELAALIREAELGAHPPMEMLRTTLYRAAARLLSGAEIQFMLLHYLVALPLVVCTKAALALAVEIWGWVMTERPEMETSVISEIRYGWARTIRKRQGIYTPHMAARNAMHTKMNMSATNRDDVTREMRKADTLFSGHALVLQLLSDRLQASRSSNGTLVTVLVGFVQRLVEAAPLLSNHALLRETRLAMVLFCLRVLSFAHLDVQVEFRLRDGVLRLGIDWFASPIDWTYGGSTRRAHAELQFLKDVQLALRTATVRADYVVNTASVSQSGKYTVHSAQPITPWATLAQVIAQVQSMIQTLQALLQHEEMRLVVWLRPTVDDHARPVHVSLELLHTAWRVDPRVAVQIAERWRDPELKKALGTLVRRAPHRAVDSGEALEYVIADKMQLAAKDKTDLRWLLVWAPVTPVAAVDLLQPDVSGDPLVLQYAMRVLEQFPVDTVFFYIPQIVQTLREDKYGYAAQYILKTSLISQLFCHQIIWNMNANKYKDDNAEVEDPLKPTLDTMVERIVAQLSGPAKEFYEREFSFFTEVTSISGKLKPYIKKSKLEKKAKIDEEMAKVTLEHGAYLPSNPDGVVVDLDRTSGRPLQSHAKAPFMATFLVRRELEPSDDAEEEQQERYHDVWQSAIFKVGDDCRQDVLALQVIAQFKAIFMSVGLDVYLDPYRVTATEPGCGVIDVVPNATSRDEMGRAKVNDLLTFFKTRYGGEESIAFQKARINFIQSMAAYSVVCHILQIRDRHNGNIMIDGGGHVIHIDFGFLFDIGPGGMRFEPYSFKLSMEMVAVMGGHDSPGFAMFEELVVKAYLACRPYAHAIVTTCGLMLGTDLPSFKGPGTMVRLMDRFKPHLSERDAARHAVWLVKDAYGNRRAVLYDMIQEKQNHIPYRR